MFQLFSVILEYLIIKLVNVFFVCLYSVLFVVVPTALGTALDINLSNASLVFISVTFATMVCSILFYYILKEIIFTLAKSSPEK